MHFSSHKRVLLVLAIFIILIAASCNQVPETVVLSETPEEAVVATIAPTETSVPTPTTLPKKIVLSAPMETEYDLYIAIQDYLVEWTSQSGYTLEVKEGISPDEVQPDWAGIVFLREPENLDAFQSAAPDMALLVLSESGLVGEGNLSVLQLNTVHQTFIAGYISLLAAPDWRAAGLLPWDDAEMGAMFQEAFTNGAAYYCGRCASTYTPVTLFPVMTSLPSNSTMEAWLDVVNTMNLNTIIYVVYLSPEAASDALINALYAQNYVMVGGEAPPVGVNDRWAATVSMDVFSAFETLLPDVFSGVNGQTVVVPVKVGDVNPELLSDGRLELVEKVQILLEEGVLLPLSPDYP